MDHRKVYSRGTKRSAVAEIRRKISEGKGKWTAAAEVAQGLGTNVSVTYNWLRRAEDPPTRRRRRSVKASPSVVTGEPVSTSSELIRLREENALLRKLVARFLAE